MAIQGPSRQRFYYFQDITSKVTISVSQNGGKAQRSMDVTLSHKHGLELIHIVTHNCKESWAMQTNGYPERRENNLGEQLTVSTCQLIDP